MPMCHDSDSLKIAVYNTTFYSESEQLFSNSMMMFLMLLFVKTF